jgi:hypothetical protein
MRRRLDGIGEEGELEYLCSYWKFYKIVESFWLYDVKKRLP